mgnify:CR=1 FL=1
MQPDSHVGHVNHGELKKTLSTLQLWGIAVGLVISGEYFGWSYGWGTAGTLGFVVTALFVAVMGIAARRQHELRCVTTGGPADPGSSRCELAQVSSGDGRASGMTTRRP